MLNHRVQRRAQLPAQPLRETRKQVQLTLSVRVLTQLAIDAFEGLAGIFRQVRYVRQACPERHLLISYG